MIDGEAYCKKCQRTRPIRFFYKSRNLTKYPRGVFDQCKQCLTMHVDNWVPETYLWILKEADVPYLPWVWDRLLAEFGRNRTTVTGTTIIGRYLAGMNITQYKNARWEDSEVLKEVHDKEVREAMTAAGFSESEIIETINKGTYVMSENLRNPPPPPTEPEESNIPTGVVDHSYSSTFSKEEIDLGLTDKEILGLKIKWGKGYEPFELVQLEKLYNDMMNSYDIQEAGHIDTLKLICKTSLKANNLIDLGDMEGFSKGIRAYNDLMKSGNFTAAQNKAENGEFINSVSELIELCEKQGFIPRYYVDEPRDKVDRVIEDMQRYTKSLITEEMGLEGLIERAVEQLRIQKENEVIYEDEDDDDALFDYGDSDAELTEEDYEEFQALEDELKQEDLYEYLTQGEKNDGAK